MITITLPPELAQAVKERAHRQGTTPELWTLDRLRQSLTEAERAQPAPTPSPEGGTMFDFFADYVGVLHSSEFVPGGAQMSQDTGNKFAEAMLEKHRKGKL